MNFLSYCVPLCSHLLSCLLIKKITIVVDISTRFNANKSIIYNSHRDLSSLCVYAKVMRKFEFCSVLKIVERTADDMRRFFLLLLMNLVQYLTREAKRRFLTEMPLLSYGERDAAHNLCRLIGNILNSFDPFKRLCEKDVAEISIWLRYRHGI